MGRIRWKSLVRIQLPQFYLINRVSFCKQRNTWEAYIGINNKKKGLGYFKYLKDAALKYNDAAQKEFGDFARLNNISNLQL